MIVPDVNLLVYAHDATSRRHNAARAWWETLLSGTTSVGLPWNAILGFIRVTTHGRILQNPLDSPWWNPASYRERRGARLTRREEGAYWTYATDEQRRQAGCIAARMQRGLSPRAVDVGGACSRVRSWIARPQAILIHPGDRHADILFDLLDAVGVAGNLTTDAHLAALAIEHQAELHSTDADMARFPGLRWKNPLA